MHLCEVQKRKGRLNMEIRNKGDTEEMSIADLLKELIEENKRLTEENKELKKTIEEIKKAASAGTHNGKE